MLPDISDDPIDYLEVEERESMDVFQKVCEAKGLGVPEAEYRFHPIRKWRFDYAWPNYKVALEVEGGAFVGGRHTRGKGYKDDLEKYSEAAILGWLVLRLIPEDLLSRGSELAVRALIARGCPVPDAAVQEIERVHAVLSASQKQSANSGLKIRSALANISGSGRGETRRRSRPARAEPTSATKKGASNRRGSGIRRTPESEAA